MKPVSGIGGFYITNRLAYTLAIAAIFFLISVASCGLDSGNTGLSPIPFDLKGYGADQAAPENTGAEVLTNRKNALSNNSSLADVLNEDVMPEDLPAKILQVVGVNIPERVTKKSSNGFEWPTLSDLRARDQGLKEFMDEIEEHLLLEALQESRGVKNQAAELLGIKRTTLIEKLKKRSINA